MFTYDCIADVYALAFAATQGVSRHNEVVLSRHRSRLRNRKNKVTDSTEKDSRRASPGCNQPLALDERPPVFEEEVALHPHPAEFDYPIKAAPRLIKDEIDQDDDIDVEKVDVSDDDEEDYDYGGLNAEKLCNNNNDLNCNFNKLSKSSHCIGSPVEAFPPSLIKWPLNNGVKSKRLSDIRKQVKKLSTAIKMTIDSDGENSPDGKGNFNPAPFSSLVDMSLIPIDSSSGASQLPSVEDLDSLLRTNKTKESKAMVRESDWGIDHIARRSLWKRLVLQVSKDEFSDSYYWDTVQQIYGSKDMSECNVVLPTFVDRKLMSTFGLSTDGIKACERVVSVIAYNSPAITYAPLVYPLTSILMHYMEEPDTYNCMTVLLSKSSSFVSQTKIMHESMWRTVDILARKHMRGSYSMLNKFGITPQQVNEGFQNWTSWMFSHLPLNHLIRIVDCFLLEGSKVLLRASLAIFHLFMKQVSRDSNIAAMLTTKGLAEAVSVYSKNIQAKPAKLLKTAFGIRALSKSEIKKIVTQTEMVVKSDPCMGGSSGLGSLVRTSSLENLPTSESQENIQAMSHTLDIKELLTIWSWIPMRMTMNHPKLVYTTQEHGSSLTNFFLRVNKCEPTLLLVRTTNDEVFGAYCSSAWSLRNQRDEFGHKQTYFGTGETFLFTLKPEVARYEWVGITQQRENAGLASVAHQSELFMHADNDMITVGGGHGHGLMLDHELQFGKTERCETFNNPPLCSTPDFEIKVVEVFSLGEDV